MTQPTLIESLLQPSVYPHTVKRLELIETHISWVILTGQYAYKLKKPVNLGFLDFSTLERRKFFCEEELRLNRRLAPDLYLEVTKITGTVNNPEINGTGDVIEYAVKMHQFEQRAQLDRVLQRNELSSGNIDDLVQIVSRFHQAVPVAGEETTFGSPDSVYHPVAENFSQIRERLYEKSLLERLVKLEQWSRQHYEILKNAFIQRKQKGFVRECHGDMHLRNMALVNKKVIIFDCIEFNPDLRWVDVISEIAFLVMDLQDREQPFYAQRFLNSYLEQTGDYSGLTVFRFYQMYRAMVRAKVDAIRLDQPDISSHDREGIYNDLEGYLDLAESYATVSKPCLIITFGVSGSGKTTYTQPVLEQLPAIRIRSDVERKRLFGLNSDSHKEEQVGRGIYQRDMTEQTYHALARLAHEIITTGHSVIIDATFLNPVYREQFNNLAYKLNVPFVILSFNAPENVLRERVKKRQKQSRDASDATVDVLEYQLKNCQPLSLPEQANSIEIDTGANIDIEEVLGQIKTRTAMSI